MGSAPGAEPGHDRRPSAEELARHVVREVAPQELPSFGLVAAPYLEGPRRAARFRGRMPDDAVGSGIAGVAGLVTPEIVLVCWRLLDALGQGAADELRSRSATATGRVLDWFGRKGKKSVPDVAPNPAEVRRLTLEQAAAVGMRPELAAAVADVVVRALTNAQHGT
jgi:hypothetical protein